MKYSIDTHTHTLVSGHAYNTIDEMAAYAAGIGVTHPAITDHAPKMPGSAGTLYFSNMGIIPRQKCGVKIYMGCEVNIMDYDGNIDLKECGQVSGCIRNLSIWHSPVFLLNSCLDLFSAPNSRWDPLSRSYRVNLPSSLTVNHSSALVYSTRLRVSVCGTGTLRIKFSGFSWEYAYTHYYLIPKNLVYYQVRLLSRICLG